VQALVFENHLPRLAATRLLGALWPGAYVGPTAPIALRELPDPELPRGDWVVLRTRLCGICGSDTKQVFLDGATDNPMTALISFPQVLGHEVVATVERVGPDVRALRPGARIVLNPWLSCAPRGLAPCAWCARGEYAQCRAFTRGGLAPGIHHGNSASATGGFAPLLPAHESQCIAVPDGVPDEDAVLADPFSVSLHAVLREPPPAGGIALVYGCGTLGLLAIAILRALHPSVRVLAVARFAHQAALARKLGAEAVLAHRPTEALIEAVAEATGAEVQRPWRGLPMLSGGVDAIYDSVASAETLEVGLRVAAPRARIVLTGVATPRRFEWTPLYFKEVAVVGSNAFAVERFEGREQHAMAWYFVLLGRGALAAPPLVTHRFPLARWREALRASREHGRSGAVKVVFDYRDAA
jgi:threonine dehydrogenase-like Zn-dependent dehydrogenase